jgi:small ligand-binding sensory domain FIST
LPSFYFRHCETIQFHVRDAATATEDLEMMLAPQLFFDPPAGGLHFSCNGRGTRLYDYPNGDISTIQNVIGQFDLAGFFCAGEIGRSAARTFSTAIRLAWPCSDPNRLRASQRITERALPSTQGIFGGECL